MVLHGRERLARGRPGCYNSCTAHMNTCVTRPTHKPGRAAWVFVLARIIAHQPGRLPPVNVFARKQAEGMIALPFEVALLIVGRQETPDLTWIRSARQRYTPMIDET